MERGGEERKSNRKMERWKGEKATLPAIR